PQTKFVLRQALRRGHRVVLVVNKIDRPSARPNHVLNETFDLFLDLGATEEQAEFATLYTNAILGTASADHRHEGTTLEPLFDAILERIPPPDVDPDAPAQLLVTTTSYDDYIGRIAVGRLQSGALRRGQAVARIDHSGKLTPAKVTQLFTFNGLARDEVEEARAGDIVAVAGIDAGIGDTIADAADPRPLPPIRVEEPTLKMSFTVNNSPSASRDAQGHEVPRRRDGPLRVPHPDPWPPRLSPGVPHRHAWPRSDEYAHGGLRTARRADRDARAWLAGRVRGRHHHDFRARGGARARAALPRSRGRGLRGHGRGAAHP